MGLRTAAVCLLVVVAAACSSQRMATRSSQVDELRYRELLLILPADADRSRLAQQELAVKDGKYYHKDGRLLPLRRDTGKSSQPKLDCRTCETDAPVLQDKKNAKQERLEPYILKVE